MSGVPGPWTGPGGRADIPIADDLSPDALAACLGAREFRAYPAVLSTEATATAWARAGAPSGAVVVAEHQAAPRGRGGLPWEVRSDDDLVFSLVVRPDLPVAREGWLYVVAAAALADLAGDGAVIAWPDEVLRDGRRWAAVAVHADLEHEGPGWAVVTVHVRGADLPRSDLLADAVGAVERRYNDDPDVVLADYRERCVHLGRSLRATIVPTGPQNQPVTGVARDVKADGALVLETRAGRRIAVRPQFLGTLEEAL